MIERWGAFVARRALAVLLVGLAVTLAAAAYGFGVFDSLSQGGFDDRELGVGPRAGRRAGGLRQQGGRRGRDLLQRRADRGPTRRSGPRSSARRRAHPRARGAAWSPTTPPRQSTPGLVSQDGHSAQVLISLAGDSQDDYLTNYDELAPTLEAGRPG